MPGPVSLVDVMTTVPGDRDALVVGDRRWTGDDLTAAAARLAAGLAASGAGPGDTVAFQAPTAGETVLLYRACWHLGAVAAALHPQAGRDQLVTALDQLEPVLTFSTPGGGAPPGRTIPTTADTWAALTDGDPLVRPEIEPTAPALVLFTSGSSGTPKGVVHTGAALGAKATQLLDIHELGPGDAVLMPAPLAHISGLLHGVLLPAVGAVKAVLMAKWAPHEALELIEREQITYMVGPPTFFTDLMDHPDFTSERVRSLRFLSCGGTGITPGFVHRAADELGCLVKRSYGSTEAPTVTTSRNDDPVDKMVGTDGRAHGDTRIRIVPALTDGPTDRPTDEGSGTGEGEEGEVWVTGPELATGYLDESAGEQAFVDGWFRTGDLGRLDDGWLTITGRIGERIIRGGENISPRAVAEILESHPAVREAAVVGVPDERLGEVVGAAVVTDAPLDLDECRRWFAEQHASRLLTPEVITVVDQIPRLASGKPDPSAILAALSESGS